MIKHLCIMFLFIILTGTNPAFGEGLEITPMDLDGQKGYWISEENLKIIDQALNYLFLLDEEYGVLLEANETLKGEVMRLNAQMDVFKEENTSLTVQRNISIGVGVGLVGLSVVLGLFAY